mmetsp:Transcript_17123/g.39650  ORF Transcript_17123/g.39650 Transcript_17123/m.39650 type:complete len:533 (-) Transcript_17123:4193-5791(-)
MISRLVILILAVCLEGISGFCPTYCLPSAPAETIAIRLKPFQQHSTRPFHRPVCRSTTLSLASDDNDDDDDHAFLNSDDPFAVLQLSSGPTADAKEIRKAYRRMAVRFHPDVATNKDSTAHEKKQANDRFAKINWAYQQLSGKNADGKSSTQSTSSSKSSSSSGWEPPHRRTASSYSSNSAGGGRSTDWRDYIPNYRQEPEDDLYDAGGDSFGAIFADLFSTASAGAVGGGGILKDFVEFLEGGGAGWDIDGGFSSSSSSSLDRELTVLLQTGSLEEIAEEMDDAVLVEQQLDTKLGNLRQDALTLQADLPFANRLTEKMNLQEELAEVQARLPIVENYLKQARKRSIALQTRYKELIVGGQKAPSSNSGESVWDEIKREASSSGGSGGSSSSSYSSRTTRTTNSAGAGGRSTTGSSRNDDDDKDAWKSDSFGSFGRGRGSRGRGSRSRSSQRTASSSSSSSSYTSSSTRTNPTRPTSAPSSPRTQPSPRTVDPQVPPHRRPTGSSFDEDKRRLRELKVDEEFDKLKKELGL